MPVSPRHPGRLVATIALAVLAAACSAAGATEPAATSAPPTASAASSLPPVASTGPSTLPSAAPTESPTEAPARTPAATSGGGRYGGGGGSSTPAAGLVIRSSKTALGTVLVGSDGLTLYIHAGDGTNRSTCTGDCAAAWPPVLVTAGSKVSAGPGVHGTLATFKRADGTIQVSYNGRPLYAWTGDYVPGDTTGQGIGGFTVAKA